MRNAFLVFLTGLVGFMSGCSSTPAPQAELYGASRPIFTSPTREEIEESVEIAKLRLQRETIDARSECVEKLMEVFRGSAGDGAAVMKLLDGLNYIMSSITPVDLPELPAPPQTE